MKYRMLLMNDEIPSLVAMLVRDYRNRAHVTGCNGSCKKQTQKRGFLNDNKGIDTIDLPKTLHSKRVTKPIPSFLDIVTPPIISITYPKTIASKIFNFKNTLAKLGFDVGTADMSCSCNASTYNYVLVGHIVTGDLNVVRGRQLRKFSIKGPA